MKTLVGMKVELVKAKIACWFTDKNKYLVGPSITTQWYMTIVKETEKAVQVKIYDERKHQTADSSNWSLWIPKSALGFLN